MKRCLPAMLAALLLLGGCSMLPGEERAFAVAMGVGMRDGAWEVSARIPTYQAGGGYATVSAQGDSLGAAMAQLSVTAPMELHYGQLRLLIIEKQAAEAASLTELVRTLSARGEIRPQAVIAMTEESARDMMDALMPETGSRLSKSLDSLLAARERAGTAERITLEVWRQLGHRQQPVLINVGLEAETDKPKAKFSGGWMQGGSGAITGYLTDGEMQLLSLMRGKIRQGTLTLEDGTLVLLDADSRITLKDNAVHCILRIRYSASTTTEDGARDAVAKALQNVADKLSRAGCDALGIARKAAVGMMTSADWLALNWQERYPALTWHFTVEAEREA